MNTKETTMTLQDFIAYRKELYEDIPEEELIAEATQDYLDNDPKYLAELQDEYDRLSGVDKKLNGKTRATKETYFYQAYEKAKVMPEVDGYKSTYTFAFKDIDGDSCHRISRKHKDGRLDTITLSFSQAKIDTFKSKEERDLYFHEAFRAAYVEQCRLRAEIERVSLIQDGA